MRPPLSNFLAALALVLIGWVFSTQPGQAGGVSFQAIGYGIIGFAFVALIVVSARYKNFGAALRFAWNPTENVSELVKSWKLPDGKTHKQYQNSLSTHLASKLPDIKVTSESGGGRIRADIEVGKDIVIELKPNFDSTSKLQQLIGQIELYKREFRGRRIIVVLVGDTDRNTLQHLEDTARGDQQVRIIDRG